MITEFPIYYFTHEIFFAAFLKFRYTDSEIESKVEELRSILCEQEGIASKDNKEGKSTYVHLYSNVHVFFSFFPRRFWGKKGYWYYTEL